MPLALRVNGMRVCKGSLSGFVWSAIARSGNRCGVRLNRATPIMCELSNHVGVREVTNEAATESIFKMSDYTIFENWRPDFGQNTLM